MLYIVYSKTKHPRIALSRISHVIWLVDIQEHIKTRNNHTHKSVIMTSHLLFMFN